MTGPREDGLNTIFREHKGVHSLRILKSAGAFKGKVPLRTTFSLQQACTSLTEALFWLKGV